MTDNVPYRDNGTYPEHDRHEWGEHAWCPPCLSERQSDRRAELIKEGPSTLRKSPAKAAGQRKRWGTQ